MRLLTVILVGMLLLSCAHGGERGVSADDGQAYADSLRAAYEQEMAQKNAPGTVAPDFRMLLADGRVTTLREFVARADSTVLVFYDPACPHCDDIIWGLADDPMTPADVLAVYAEGDTALWRSTLRDLPRGWTVARDLDSIVDRDIYNLPAMPTILLLDRRSHILVCW